MPWGIFGRARVGGHGAIRLASESIAYRIKAGTKQKARALSILQHLVSVCEESFCGLEAPTTPKEWAQCYRRIQDVWAKPEFRSKVPGLKPSIAASKKAPEKQGSKQKDPYSFAWFIRSVLLSRMRAAGIKRLKEISDVSLQSFGATFADQRSHLQYHSPQMTGSLSNFFLQVTIGVVDDGQLLHGAPGIQQGLRFLVERFACAGPSVQVALCLQEGALTEPTPGATSAVGVDFR